jgi:amino acid adenylation domain-containing protein
MKRCCIVGSGSLVKECIEILIEHSFEIMAVFSDDNLVASWCQSKFFKSFTLEELVSINLLECDYLFSIANPQILSHDILKSVKKLAINYHDSLLPKHAGVNATSWAILQNEKIHGVSWHQVSNEIDAGDILLQKTVEITEDETSFSLNLKCYEIAIQSFRELIIKILNREIFPKKQNAHLRTYHGLNKKPSGNGFLNLNDSRQKIMLAIRGLFFGPTANSLAATKIVLNKDIYVITAAKCTDQNMNLIGAKIDVKNNTLIVPLIDGCLIIEELKSLDNKIIQPMDLLRGGNEDTVEVSFLTENILSDLTLQSTAVSCFEKYWIKQLNNLNLSTSLPVVVADVSGDEQFIWNLDLEAQSIDRCCTLFQSNRIQIIIAILNYYFFRINNYQAITIKLFKNYDYQFVKRPVELPINIALENSKNIFDDIVSIVEEISSKFMYEPDIFCRYPELGRDLKNIHLAIVVDELPKNTSKINHTGLTFRIKKSGKLLALQCYSNLTKDQYSEVLLQNMPAHLLNIVDALLTSKQLTETSILSADEKILFEKFNQVPDHKNNRDTILNIFQRNAKDYPDAIAVVENNKTYIYADIHFLSNALAHELRAVFVEKYGYELISQKVIAVHCHSGLSYVLSVLACLRLGCLYVPIDPAYPCERKKHIIQDSVCCLLICDCDINFVIAPDLLQYRMYLPNLLNQPPAFDLNLSTDEDLLYLMYTSGSTGQPKGVQISQENFLNLLQWYCNLCLKRTDRTLILSSLSFDLTQKNIVGQLVAGGSLFFLDNKDIYEPKDVADIIEKNHITHVNCITGVFLTLIENDNLLPKLKSLINIVLGGSVFSAGVLAGLYKLNPSIKIYNSYGPAECTDVCACYTITEQDIFTNSNLPIGHPINRSELFILDKYSQLLPMGVVGEIGVVGRGVGRGYINKDQLTALVFKPNRVPLSRFGGHLYHTGDNGLIDVHGKLYFMNRKDKQVKVRGFRIELGEIEIILSKNIKLLQSIVLCPISKGERKIIVFVVPRAEAFLTEDELYEYMREHLPTYMLPHQTFLLDKFPLTTHNKVDTEKLLAIVDQEGFVSAKYEKLIAMDSIELDLVQIWEKLLGTKHLHNSMNFFRSGGDSLLATKLAYKIESHYKIAIKILNIYQNPLFSQLCDFIRKEKLKDEVKQPKEDIALAYFSEQQISILHLERIYPELAYLYNSCYCFEIMGDLNITYLSNAIEYVYENLDILKENYIFDNESLKKVLNVSKINIDVVNAIDNTGDDKIVNRRMNISKDVLINVTIQTAQPRVYYLYIAIHHCISDAESIDLICQYISKVYSCMSLSKAIPQINQQRDYAHYINWQQQYFKTLQYQSKLNSYAAELNDLKPMVLPYDIIPSARFKFSTRCEFFELEPTLFSNMSQFCESAQIGIFSFLWSAISLLLYKHQFMQTIFAGTYVANRYPSDYSDTIGIFSNMLIIRADIDERQTFLDFIKQIHLQLINQIDYQCVPTKHLAKKLKLEYQDNTTLMFPLGIEFVGASLLNSLEIEGCDIAPKIINYSNGKFNLSFRFHQESREKLSFLIEYNEHMFNRETILNLKNRFITCLQYMLTSSQDSIDSLSILSSAERSLLRGLTLSDEQLGVIKSKCQIPMEDARKYNCIIYGVDRKPVPMGVPGQLSLFLTEQTEDDICEEYQTKYSAKYNNLGEVTLIGLVEREVECSGLLFNLQELEHNITVLDEVENCVFLLNNKLFDLYVIPAGNFDLKQFRNKVELVMPYHVPLGEIKLIESDSFDNFSLENSEFLSGLSQNTQESFESNQDIFLTKIAALWAEHLGIEHIGFDDNFFALGGDSLLALLLVDQLEKKYGIVLRLNDFFQFPSIRRLANYIGHNSIVMKDAPALTKSVTEGTSQDIIRVESPTVNNSFNEDLPLSKHKLHYEPIIQLNKSNKPLRNLFCVHPGYNSGHAYQHFAKNFSTEIQFYAINSFNYYHNESILDIRSLAERYIQELLIYQEHGPYYLAGWSLGGTIAYEMAQQLERAGKKIAAIYLFDPFVLTQDIKQNFIKSYKKFAALKVDFINHTNDSQFQDIEKLLNIELDMLIRYNHEKYSGKVILFKSRKIFSTSLVQDNDEKLQFSQFQQTLVDLNKNGFERLCSDLTVVDIESDHHHLLDWEFGIKIATMIQDDMM